MDWFCLLLNLTWNCVVCPILPLALSSNIMCSGCIHNVPGSKHPLLLVLHVVFHCGIQYGTQYLADMNILVHVFWFGICADFSWLSDLNGLFRSQGGLFCLVIINITRDFKSSSIHYHPLSGMSSISSVQLLSHVRLFATPWTAAPQASPSITNSQRLLKLMSIELVMPFNHLIIYCPLLHPPSILPSIKIFSN